jgi:hypothetical protein
LRDKTLYIRPHICAPAEDNLMSFLTRLLGKKNEAGGKEPYKWKDQELGIYFTPKPNDPIWKPVTPRTAELIQQGFLEIYGRTELKKYSDTNKLPQHVINTIREVANEVGEKNNLNPAFRILISHQYVDADQLVRQMYKTRWVAFMVERSQYAPPPESYMKYIKSQYFSGDE